MLVVFDYFVEKVLVTLMKMTKSPLARLLCKTWSFHWAVVVVVVLWWTYLGIMVWICSCYFDRVRMEQRKILEVLHLWLFIHYSIIVRMGHLCIRIR